LHGVVESAVHAISGRALLPQSLDELALRTLGSITSKLIGAAIALAVFHFGKRRAASAIPSISLTAST
jgi:hypothetical protein